MFQSIKHEETVNTNLAISYSKVYDLANQPAPVYGCSVQAIYTDATPAAVVTASASISGNVFTHASHGLTTGTVGQMTTSTALPTPLLVLTNYYVIALTANTFSLASSLANAQAGTAITLSDAGTGNQTFTPTAISGIVVKAQMSNDGTNYTDISGKTVTISAAGSVLWDLGATTYRYLRVLETPSAGVLNLTLNFNGVNEF